MCRASAFVVGWGLGMEKAPGIIAAGKGVGMGCPSVGNEGTIDVFKLTEDIECYYLIYIGLVGSFPSKCLFRKLYIMY